MTTSISSEAHENMNKSMIKRRKNLVGKKNKKTFILYSLIFSHCSMPERPTDKVNYIIDALLISAVIITFPIGWRTDGGPVKVNQRVALLSKKKT